MEDSVAACCALVPRGRPKGPRPLAIAAALVLISAAFACSAPVGGTPSAPVGGTPSAPVGSTPSAPAGTPTVPGAISIPTANLSAYAQCMIANGWRIIALHSAGPGDAEPGYDWTRDNDGKSAQEINALLEKCQALRPSPRPLTDAEIRVIYDRWVGEYHCMVTLGYQPDPPPSSETFLATWQTGPWDPTFGVDIDHWTQAQYNEAKAKCTLEFLTMDIWGPPPS